MRVRVESECLEPLSESFPDTPFPVDFPDYSNHNTMSASAEARLIVKVRAERSWSSPLLTVPVPPNDSVSAPVERHPNLAIPTRSTLDLLARPLPGPASAPQARAS